MNHQKGEIARHVFTFNPKDFGDEEFVLTTVFIENESDPPIINQELKLQSNCNSASFNLHGTILTPERLRKCADSLEKFQNHLKQSVPDKDI